MAERYPGLFCMVGAILLTCCSPIAPESKLWEPSIVAVSEAGDYASAVLTVTFDHTENLKTAGFYLWREMGEKQRQESSLNGNVATARYTALEPEPEYSYSVFYSNGLDEAVSETRHFTTAPLPMPEVAEILVETTQSEASLQVCFTGLEFLQSCSLRYWISGKESRVEVPLLPEGEAFECTLSDLIPDTEYGYSVRFSNGKKTAETDPAVFRTQAAPEPEPDPHPDPKPLPKDQFDPALWTYLVNRFDADSDGILTDVELAAAVEIDISGIQLDSQAGLEYCVNLETIYTFDNWLEKFDLSANKKLKAFICYGSPHLKELILDNSELLQTYLSGTPNLHSLDFRHCPRLYVCQWYDVGLTSVDLSLNDELYSLQSSGTQLKELDLVNCRRLCILESSSNPSLETIWLKKGIILDSCEVESHTQIKYK